MNRRSRTNFVVMIGGCVLATMIVSSAQTVWGRGFGGGGGGGFRGGGGGGFGGGGGARPSMPSRAPSVSRPAPAARPAPSRPSTPQVSRPSGGANRPSGGNVAASRPGNVTLPNGQVRPGTGAKPPVNAGGGAKPGLTPGTRPSIDSRPGNIAGGAGNRPGVGTQPGTRPTPGTGLAGGSRPGINNSLPGATRPGSNLPGTTRPGTNLPGAGNRPTTLPGLAAGGIAGSAVGDRMGNLNRGDLAQTRENWNRGPASRQDFMNDRVANRQDRATSLQDRMSERGDNWQDRRDQWQDNRGDRWDDFHENFWDNYYDFRHDSWNNRFDAWWDHMWDEHPVAMGLGITAWGVNRLSFWFGYGGGYYNPYAGEPVAMGGGAYCDYSQPLQTYEQATMAPATSTAETSAAESETPDVLNDKFNAAKDSFYAGDYAAALNSVNQALALAKNDAVLHEFRALALFAEGKYSEAAATIHSVLAVGPGWDWTTLISLYPSADVYTQQLRALEAAVKARPEDAGLHFLLAYHYITTSSTEEAIYQLQEVNRLQPKDTVAVQVLEMIGGPQALPPAVAKQAAPPVAAGSAPTLVVKDVLGTWKATAGDSRYELVFTDKNTFRWTFEEKGKPTTVEGVFAIDGNTLAMQPDAGGTMAAELTNVKGNAFHFAVVGAPPGDKGLDFRKN